MTSAGVSAAKVAVAALAVVCVTMAILPLLNARLLALLNEHTFLMTYIRQTGETPMPRKDEIFPLLTDRESHILPLLLSGKKNREIAEALELSENTIKTRARSIYAKYGVSSRTELVVRLKDKHIPR